MCHNGVLFLDELPEFKRSALESLRQPLEDLKITISRASGTATFPAAFMLVAAMNPCKCGYYGDTRRACRCSPPEVQRYRERISGPLLDRIDLHVEVAAIKYEHLADQTHTPENSEAIRARVVAARAVQQRRIGKPNARLTPRQIKTYCPLEATCAEMLKMASNELGLSARAHDRVLKVARTVADLDGVETIQPQHLGEAIQYRSLDRGT